MIDLWWVEAAKHQVLPLDPRPMPALVGERKLPDRQRYVYYPDAAQVPELMSVNVKNRHHRVVARVLLPEDGAEGVLISQGSLLGGWCLYLKDGALHYVHNLAAAGLDVLAGEVAIGAGAHEWVFEFAKAGPHAGRTRLLADGAVIAEGVIDRFTAGRFSLTGAGITCGYSNGLPVTDDIEPPFRFTGTIETVTVEVDGPPFVDPEAETEAVIAMQ
jgi:arylsulfatase